jgi:hypothetical protein
MVDRQRREGTVAKSDPGGQDAVSRFFAQLERRGHEPLLARAKGTLKFDLREGGSGEHWYVTISHGDIAVSRRRRAADTMFTIERSVFAELVEGGKNAMAAAIRGDVQVSGDLALAIAFQRILPGPPDSSGPDTRAHRLAHV